MKIKFKIAMLFILGITLANAQTKKKTGTKKAVTTTKKATTTAVKSTAPTVSYTVSKPQVATPAVDTKTGIFAELETTKGKIVVKLEYEKTPITVANFITLAEGTNTQVTDQYKGKKFYNGLKFHRVIKDFMIQGGDPLGNGSGGPGYAFKDEINEAKFDRAGILAMANSGPRTNGSQFFITHKDTPWLNGLHTIFGYIVPPSQDIVNKIEQNDVINSITIVRKGENANKFDAVKVFTDYFAGKAAEDKKQTEIDGENKRKQAETEALKKAEYTTKYAPVLAAKVAELNAIKATSTKTDSGLQYKITQAGTGKKPAAGTQVFINYAGYLEDGSLFDSSYQEVNKAYGKFDENRAKANGYQPFPFEYGKKEGLIPGFIEGINAMSFGDKAIFFIPSKLGYGERGAGNVIPPNANIIFEVEMLQSAPVKQ